MQRGHDQDISDDLLRGLRAGSSHAWARLYDQLAPGIRRFATSCLSGDTETADDLVVETLAHAAQGIARFDPQKSSLSAWIYGIARRRVQTELRWCRRQKSIPAWAQVSFEDLSGLTDSHDLGERTAARLDAQRRIGELTGLLSDSETEVLELSAIEDLPGDEMARVVGRTEHATRSLLKRAKQKVRRTAIEGTLIVGAGRWTVGEEGWRPDSHLFSGVEDRMIGDGFGAMADFSPVGNEIAYQLQGAGFEEDPPLSRHIWKAKRDGSGAVNLSEAAGLGGLNSYPRWSPDATMIAFVHTDRTGIRLERPGEAWVMRVDGPEAQRVVPEGSAVVSTVAWSPDGSCLICRTEDGTHNRLPASADLWGRHVRLASDLMGSAEWSPDMTRVACPGLERGRAEGEPGYWRRLLVRETDAAGPRVIVEHFITDAQVDACCTHKYRMASTPADDWRGDVLQWAGPYQPRWSPRDDKVAFLAALPFDPERMAYNRQVDAWVYDLVTRRLTKITDEPDWQRSLSWR